MTNAIMIEKHPLKGIWLCMVAYLFASLIGICVKSMTTEVPLTVILFYQNIVCLLLLIPEIRKNGIIQLKTNNVTDYVVRIISGIGCSLTLFYVIRFIPISEALLYQYSAPLWIPFIMMIWLGVRLKKDIWYGIIIGFIGIIFILRPNASQAQLISLIGILCGIFQGISVVSVRRLSLKEPAFRILFYNFFFGTLIFFPFVLSSDVLLQSRDYLLLLGVGLITYLAQRFFTLSFQYANATTLGPICYTAILFSGLLGWLIWNEVIETITLFGMMLVIFGCLLSIKMSSNSKNTILIK